MPSLAEVRQQYPEYKDMSDQALASALHERFYSDMPRAEFDKKIGYSGPVSIGDVGRQALTDIKKVGSSFLSAVTGIPKIPQRAFEESERARQGLDYNIGPIVEGAMLATPVNPAVRAGDIAIPGAKQAFVPGKPPVPSTQALQQAGDAGFDAFRKTGLEVAPSSIQNLAHSIQQTLQEKGATGGQYGTAPITFDILERLQKGPAFQTGESPYISAANLHTIRRSLGEAAGKPGSEGKAGATAKAEFDRWLQAIPDEAVLAGSASATGDILKPALGNYAAAKRSNAITGDLDKAYTGVLDRADLGAAVANSGHNIDNSIRQKAAVLLRDKDALAGFTPQEVEGLDRVARGSVASNTARHIGNLLGGGGGMYQGLISAGSGAAGFMAGGPMEGSALAVGVPLAGMGIKRLSGKLTERQARKIDETIRMRSPLYADAVKAMGVTPANPEKYAAALRLLITTAQPQQ